jgi:hypothetical protein
LTYLYAVVHKDLNQKQLRGRVLLMGTDHRYAVSLWNAHNGVPREANLPEGWIVRRFSVTQR